METDLKTIDIFLRVPIDIHDSEVQDRVRPESPYLFYRGLNVGEIMMGIQPPEFDLSSEPVVDGVCYIQGTARLATFQDALEAIKTTLSCPIDIIHLRFPANGNAKRELHFECDMLQETDYTNGSPVHVTHLSTHPLYQACEKLI
ncbi:hypothetical protein ACFL1B_04485 [Nanoarchaeota archaeon]